ncbi:hypothetical protein NDU88_001757 [Pleurodeles waltl]|uniref:Uncharacterized protein n=1 Tax=Pleurodeles waltl TaxID=8319 RepID=A0AAV7W0E1_PLEWA|nr:hypothetical protein NDU88_001757 [Pleurodeles waltl]
MWLHCSLRLSSSGSPPWPHKQQQSRRGPTTGAPQRATSSGTTCHTPRDPATGRMAQPSRPRQAGLSTGPGKSDRQPGVSLLRVGPDPGTCRVSQVLRPQRWCRISRARCGTELFQLTSAMFSGSATLLRS